LNETDGPIGRRFIRPALSYVKSRARAGLIVALAAGLAADYPWGDWVGHTHWSKVGWIPFYSWPVSLPDILQNLLLFAPAGFFASIVFSRRPARWAAVLTFPFAFVGEWTQLYSHTRFPSATDLVCNIAGAAAMAAMCRRYRQAKDHT
jgi:glycopeptide antibiotics resistance protein